MLLPKVRPGMTFYFKNARFFLTQGSRFGPFNHSSTFIDGSILSKTSSKASTYLKFSFLIEFNSFLYFFFASSELIPSIAFHASLDISSYYIIEDFKAYHFFLSTIEKIPGRSFLTSPSVDCLKNE